MIRLLFIFGDWLLKGFVRSVLMGAGLGLATGAGLLVAINTYIDHLVSQFGTLSSDVLGLLAMSGVHIALSSIIGAVVFRLTLNSAKVTLIKKGG
ncbi:DUF2523 domain-containing protein [Acinetobacter pollinis]|uniref:DUF2523 domain-containing protein n=1 Tax=Acinetobacter pollinis TaxID=2605270 RepID=UPI0018A25AC4|nr:DUF2523 domain-containing protein [Acinetobacter pollinis]MBF7691731.1 DUF2523 domain-containing protein [Acinetobacter pollinis]MBF7699362.1 DUF2523 domain-containing protein [Acinetobacter pollinis]